MLLLSNKGIFLKMQLRKKRVTFDYNLVADKFLNRKVNSQLRSLLVQLRTKINEKWPQVAKQCI